MKEFPIKSHGLTPTRKLVPSRDLITPSGKKLTLMNPAYMLRQMMEEYSQFYGVKGRITGLKYYSPATAPDPWERESIKKFQKGEREVLEFSKIDGQDYLRIM